MKTTWAFLPLAVTISLASAQTPVPREEQYVQVGPGTWHASHTAPGPLTFNVLKVDLSNAATTIEAEPGRGVMYRGESVPEISRREVEPGKTTVVGGINGDFWTMSPRPYLPVGLLVSDGFIHTRANRRRSVFAVTRDEKIHIGPVEMSIQVRTGGKSVPVEYVNVPSTSSISLFTPPAGRELPSSTALRYLLKMQKSEFLPNQPANVMISKADTDSSLTVPADTLVLSIPKGHKAVSGLTAGPAIVEARIPEVEGVVVACVGGGPTLIDNGKINVPYEDEGVGSTFTTTKHPRTAAGVSKDGKTAYLVTVDGRQPRISVGHDLYELAEYMKALGCHEALNLDGGGSTTMVVRDKVVNHPSDLKGPRPVSNSLLVVATAGSGNLQRLTFAPSGEKLTIPAGTDVEVEVEGRDENMNVVPMAAASRLQATATGGFKVESVSAGKITLRSPELASSGKLRVQAGAASGELEISSIPLLGVNVRPSELPLDPAEEVELEVAPVAAGGHNVLVQPQMLEIKATGSAATATGTKFKATGFGKGVVNVRLGTATANIPVSVGSNQPKSVTAFDAIPASQLALARGEAKLTVDGINKKEGLGALAVKYSMEHGGRSRIAVPIGQVLERLPVKLAVWVRGDGNEAWLRSTMIDSRGTTFTVDFTRGSQGIFWRDEWRRVSCWSNEITPESVNSPEVPVAPLRLVDIYLAQDQEALKASGTVHLDSLDAYFSSREAVRR